MKALVDNRTEFPLRTVKSAIRWTLDELDADLPMLVVRVKAVAHPTHFGRFYIYARSSAPRIWQEKGWTIPVPENPKHLIVGNIPVRPRGVHDRGFKTGPPPIAPKTWQESLVCIVAHEAMHLRQYLLGRGTQRKVRWSEVDAEWAEYRLLQRFRNSKFRVEKGATS